MPTTLNQYVLGRTLGTGVSCKVRLAKDQQGMRYAIKIINSTQTQSFDQLVITEVQALAQLEHKNIVRLVEVNEGQQINSRKGAKDVKFIVLELVGGGELFDFVALGGRLPEPVARYYFKQLLDGLGYMHQQGISHRDLKPENVLLDKNFDLKITDLGFAAPIRGRDGSGVLRTQLGTASYMAPEIHRGKEYEGARVDLFAAAIILFVIMTQRPPFSQAHPNDPHYRLIAAGRANIFWAAHAQAENGEDIYSAEFKDLFEKMMALNPAQRPTLQEVMDHPFMQGPVPSAAQNKQDFTVRKGLVDADAHQEREAKRQRRQEAQNSQQVHRNNFAQQEDGDIVQNRREAWEMLEVEEYGPYYIHDFTQFFTTSAPLDFFVEFVNYLESEEIEHRISSSKLRVSFSTALTGDQNAIVDMQVLKVNENKCCVKFTYKDPTDKTKQIEQTQTAATLQHFTNTRNLPAFSNFCDATFDD